MQHAEAWTDPVSHITRTAPDAPVLYFSPDRLQATARSFQAGFPGLVTYAVKANPGEESLSPDTGAQKSPVGTGPSVVAFGKAWK